MYIVTRVYTKLPASLNKYHILFALVDFLTFHVDIDLPHTYCPILNISLTISKHRRPLSAFIA